ncbi:kinase-like protein [Laetiporus sulphureus 93-53]|uniref:Kinase-like protein n=1 Tax=Laetiporus sulphureus 93-53 TaxID=1314785 RepID=A0A165CYT2_9APHY|nr:kinase-like protein [Laetiporus sulphureus 93-53]KZT03769.1 kinase-like protein [Laetiporus sulphureus 93-53]
MVATDAAGSPSPPPLGTLIDNESLELVEILGYGGYGVVYRAVDTLFPEPTSYAVKCLPHSSKRNSTRQRSLHLREITLHRFVSVHPNVVTLHRVIEEGPYTFLVMDYCEDGDLFSQILHHRRYLGNNALIKDVFLQLLDAVDYCHEAHIYHRDLKPENVLCFDGGMRLAITDFGLATTEEKSTEFRTGSVYHMSPECQGGAFAPSGHYSPRSNDVWSLGIILLNLITGRNPWKSAAADDCTFQAYLRDPLHFLPTVLPISQEVNELLTRVLCVDWRDRITLCEMHSAIQSIDNFYSPDVFFEDSMARCPWEAGVNLDSDSESVEEAELEAQEVPAEDEGFVSTWSGSESEMVFASNAETEDSSWNDSESYEERESYSRSMSPSPASPLFATTKLFDSVATPSNPSTYSLVSSSPSIPSLPATPGLDSAWRQPEAPAKRPTLKLNLNTNSCKARCYDDSLMMISARSTSMHTALESQIEAYGMYSPYLADRVPEKTPLLFTDAEDVGMVATPVTGRDSVNVEVNSVHTYPTIEVDTPMSMTRPDCIVVASTSGSSTAVERPQHGWELFPRAPNLTQEQQSDSSYSFLDLSSTPVRSPCRESAWTVFSVLYPDRASATRTEDSSGTSTADAPRASPSPVPIHSPLSSCPRDRKVRTSSFLNPIRLAFPKRSSSPFRSPLHRDRATESAPAMLGTSWAFSHSTSSSPSPQPYLCLPPLAAEKTEMKLVDNQCAQRRKRLRSARAWFSPSKLISAVLP